MVMMIPVYGYDDICLWLSIYVKRVEKGVTRLMRKLYLHNHYVLVLSVLRKNHLQKYLQK